jgi:hypothetical protein
VHCRTEQEAQVLVADLQARLAECGLEMHPTKTKIVYCKDSNRKGNYPNVSFDFLGYCFRPRRAENARTYFLGFTLYCTRNRKGNFKVGMRTEKSRLRRSLMSLQEKMRQMRHLTIGQQVDELNDALRGHYGYYGIAGNFRALQKVYRHVERYWCGMLRSRSWAARRLTWTDFNQLKEKIPLLRPKLRLPFKALQALAVL